MSGLNPFRHSRKPVPETTFPNPQSQRVNQTGNNNHNNTAPGYYGHDDDAGENKGREAGPDGASYHISLALLASLYMYSSVY